MEEVSYARLLLHAMSHVRVQHPKIEGFRIHQEHLGSGTQIKQCEQ